MAVAVCCLPASEIQSEVEKEREGGPWLYDAACQPHVRGMPEEKTANQEKGGGGGR